MGAGMCRHVLPLSHSRRAAPPAPLVPGCFSMAMASAEWVAREGSLQRLGSGSGLGLGSDSGLGLGSGSGSGLGLGPGSGLGLGSGSGLGLGLGLRLRLRRTVAPQRAARGS